MIDEDINERMARLVPQPGGIGEMPSQIPLGISMTPTFERPNAAPDIDTDYADAARRIADSRRTQMMSSLVNITAVDPDSAARSQKLGAQFGVGGDLAARNAEELRQRAFIDSISGRDMLRRNPVLADYIAQRQFAEIAHDDVDALAKTEQEFSKGWFARFDRPVSEVVSEGIAGIGEGFGRAVAQEEMFAIAERVSQRGGRMEEYEKAALESYRQEMAKGGERTGFLEEAAYMGAQQLTGAPRIIEAGMMGATAGGALGLVGGPAGFATVPAGMATGFAAGLVAGRFENSRRLETAMLYLDLLPELGHDSSSKIANTVGIFNAALDTGAAALVAKPFAGLLRGAVRQKVSEAIRQQTTRAALANAAKAYGIGVAGEVTTETVQELNNVIGSEIGRYLADKPMEIETEEGREAIATRLVDTFVATAMGMSIMGAPGPAGRLYVDTRAAKQGEQQAAKLQSMVKAIADNKLLARSPERLEEFAESAVEGTDSETTYVNAAVMHDILRQSGITEQEMDTVLPGVRAQLTEMQQNGIDLGNNDVTVPTAQMTVRLQKTPLLNQILPHARLSPDAMSITEVQQFEANREQLVAEARQIMETRQETDATFVAEAQQVEDNAFEQVRPVLDAIKIDEDIDKDMAARTIAKLRQAMVVVDAAEAGMTPLQYEREYGSPLRVQGDVAPVAPLEQAITLEQAATIDADYLAAVERGDMATAQRMVDEAARVQGQEAVTYDEQGNVVPLSRRFDITSPKLFEQAAAGPARGGFDPRTLNIFIRSGGDISTMFHELIHLRIAEYLRLAAGTNPPARVVADLDILFKFMGVEGDTFEDRLRNYSTMSIDKRAPLEEKVTYNAEIYIWEGKAPSVELRGVFDRMAAWMRRAYKSIRDNLNDIYRDKFGTDLPILTPEVRGVFDRMLATEEQIKRQAAINEMKPQFQTLEQALASGMTEAEYAAYQVMQQEAMDAAVTDMTKASLRQMQWLGNARSRLLRDLQRKHDRQRKEVRDEVADEIRLQPVYRAMEYLRTGTFVDSDGQSVKMDGPHRLDMEAVRNIYAGMPTPESLEAIRATGMAMPKNVAPDIAALGTGGKGMMGKDGIDPDVAAELFGYSSGDALIRALLAATPMKDAIDARTDEVMLARFSDLVDPKARDAAVQTALHNEARARFVAVELRFVAKATQPTRVLIEAARQAAREMIAGKRIVDVKPQEFIAAESRAARDAADLGKYEAQAKITGKAEYDRVRLAALAAGSTEEDAVRVAEEAQAAFVAARTAEREAEFKARFGASTVQQALIRAKRAQLYQNQLAAEALRVREEVDKGVKYLKQVLRDSNVKRMGADYADQIERILERFNLARLSAKARAERQSLSDWLAKLKEQGLEPDLAPEVIDEANRKPYQEMTVAEFRDLVDSVKQLEHVGKEKENIRRGNELLKFTEERDRIDESLRANFKGKITKPRSPREEGARKKWKLKKWMFDGLVAASIVRIMDGGKDNGPLWNYLIRTANAAGDMETRMRAEATKRLTEILAPVFKLGKMGGKGIYFPTIGESLNREARIVIALNMGNDGNRQRLLDGEGWTLEQLTPVLESLTEAEWTAVQEMWDFFETYRPLVAAKERRLYGKEPNWVTPTPFTVRTADGKEVRLTGGYYPIKYDPVASEASARQDAAESAKDQLRGAYTAASTRRSFTKQRAKKVNERPLIYSMFGLYSGVNEVIHDLSWHEWLIQANRLMRDEKFNKTVRETYGAIAIESLKDWVNKNAAGDASSDDAIAAAVSLLRRNVSVSGLGFNVVSAALQITGFNQSIVRVGAKWIARGVAYTVANPLRTFKEVNDKSSFMADRARTQFREINEVRNMVRGESAAKRSISLGAYFLMMRMQRMVDVPTWVGAYQKALDSGTDEDTAVALADQAVIDSQGSGMTKDQSAWQQGGEVSKLFTVFYSYMNTVYNMTAVSTMTPRSKGRLASDYLMLLVVPVVLNYALKNALTPDVDDEEPDLEKIAQDLIAEELAFLMGTMVVVREFQLIADKVTGREAGGRGYEGPAGLRGIGETMKFATQASQGEFDRAFRKSAVNMLGLATGLPSAQINRTLDGIEALAEGETENPLAPLTGVKR